VSELRLLAAVRRDGNAVPLREHADRYGPLPQERAGDLPALLEAAGLTGRGGASFPTAAKLESVRGARRRPIVLANGAEGEPASSKDKVLLSYVPHLVLDGAVLAALAVGAREAIVATTGTVASTVARAAAERRGGGVRVRVVPVPDRFVSGEETALVNFLNGGPAVPTFTPPRPFERGVDGAPTAVLNVETLANIALIARYGAPWFRSVGTETEPGTVLVSVSGAIARPGVYEVALGSPFADLLRLAGGVREELSAVLVGGYFGTWLAADEAASARLANADLSRFRSGLGARAVVAFPRSACGVGETARVARYLADESAGQCGPCVYGLAAIADNLERLARGKARPDEAALLRRRLGQVAGRGACRHPDGAVALVGSALRVFSRELDRHAAGHSCGTGTRGYLPLPARAAA
jgi:NADH:ubiquinone oxidoreductase subunit F (NADH-binding)